MFELLMTLELNAFFFGMAIRTKCYCNVNYLFIMKIGMVKSNAYIFSRWPLSPIAIGYINDYMLPWWPRCLNVASMTLKSNFYWLYKFLRCLNVASMTRKSKFYWLYKWWDYYMLPWWLWCLNVASMTLKSNFYWLYNL
jgi:hypothetical protein